MGNKDTVRPLRFVGKGSTKNWIVKDNDFSFENSKFGGDIKFINLILE